MVWFMSENVLLVFSSGRFMESCLKFFSHFEFIFLYGVRGCSKFNESHAAVQRSQHSCWKECFLIVYSCLLCQRLTIVRSLNRVWFFVIHAFLSFTILQEFAQTHVCSVSDAIQQSHPLSSPSPPAFYLSHQGLVQWINSSHQVAKVLEL